MTNEPTHLDLFTGIGGFILAAQACGFRTVAACEVEPYCRQILSERFPTVPVHGDIHQLDATPYRGVTLLTGGFPCQPFSTAGEQRGSSDDRHLWPQMRRVIEEARPRWVLGENVTGIIALELDQVLSDLEHLGYTAWPLVIPAVAVDAHHRRDRVWIVAHAERERQSGSRQLGDARHPAPSGQGQAIESGHGGGFAQWCPEPRMGRVAAGIPNRAHRLTALGNSIVPQVAQEIIQAIACS